MRARPGAVDFPPNEPARRRGQTALIGRQLGHYDVIDALGAGGMGEVYRATDRRLGRDVALKILPPHLQADGGRLERFRREARALAAIDHPSIVTVYSVEEADGVPFLTMQLVEGQALQDLIAQGPLPIPRVVAIGSALADALATAHGRAIVHRDLKPANVMISRSGQVKVLDFGLAKFADVEPGHTDETRSALATRDGVVMGTLPYMSPEQLRGQDVDHRTDVFSLGVLLYEMTTGRRPFLATGTADLAASILRDAVPPAHEHRQDVPAELSTIIDGCLQKDPGRRTQSAGELAAALRTLASRVESGSLQTRRDSASGPEPSVAVLPFQNLSADPQNEYFSDGLAEEILNELTRIDGLRVAARASSFSFRQRTADIAEIGAKLKVATVLDGSVRRAGSRVRVTVQLVDTANGFQLWSERYDREMKDIFDVQDEIARSVTERFKLTLGDQVRRTTRDVEAYELYLKGRHHWHQRSPTTLPKAIRCFQQAIAADPDFALAYAGLADCYGILRVYGWVSALDGREPARAAVSRALSLAPDLWEVQFSRGFYIFYFEPDWRSARQYFEQAVAMSPRSSLVQMYLGLFRATARLEGAEAPTRRACQLDPLSPFIHAVSAVTMLIVGNVDEANRLTERALELQPDFLPALWPRGQSLSMAGRHDEAITVLERAVMLSRAPLYVALLGLVNARAGRVDVARQLLRELEERAERDEYVPAFTFVPIHIGLGDVERCRVELARAIDECAPPLSLAVTIRAFITPFRDDPEIDRLIEAAIGW
jgi:serine/threonine protein kinase/tetratricopeptide (TPR) repeat protein